MDPRKITYPGQASDEITLRVYYKHIMAIAPFVFVTMLIGFLAFIGIFYGSTNSIDIGGFLQTGGFKLNFGIISFFLLILMIFFLLAIIWIWRRNIIIITNQHLVDMDQNGLFNRTVSTQSLGRIQDVKSQIKGPLQTIFQYGTIVVQTAGESQNFNFDYMPNPYEAEKFILEAHRRYIQEHSHGNDDGVSPAEEGVRSLDNLGSEHQDGRTYDKPQNNTFAVGRTYPPPSTRHQQNTISPDNNLPENTSVKPNDQAPSVPADESTPLDDLINN